jgi:hypothetical protein
MLASPVTNMAAVAATARMINGMWARFRGTALASFGRASMPVGTGDEQAVLLVEALLEAMARDWMSRQA